MSVAQLPITPSEATPAEASAPQGARSRRSLLAAALGGLAATAAAALGRPLPTRAAAGDPMILGQANNSGTAQTTVTNGGGGAAFTMKTTNTASGATGVFGWSSQTGPGTTRAVYAKVEGPNAYGLQAFQAGPAGSGAAVLAGGYNNDGLRAHTDNAERYAVYGVTNSSGDFAGAIRGVVQSTIPGIYSAAVTGTNLGTGSNGIGVWGSHSGSGWGVYGVSTDGIGVNAYSDTGWGLNATSSSGTGLVASSSTGTAAQIEGRLLLNGMTDIVEIGEPASPASGQARLFVRDADGFTQLCVKFPDAAVVVLASEVP